MSALLPILLCLPVAFTIAYANQIDIGNLNADQLLVVFSMAISLALWLYALLKTGFHPLLSMHCFASVWLIFVPALHHLQAGIFPAFNLRYSSEAISLASAICLVHALAFGLGYVSPQTRRAARQRTGFTPSATSIFITVAALNIAAWSFIAVNGPALYLARRIESDAAFSSTFAAVVNFALARSLIIVAVLLGIHSIYRSKQLWPLLLSLPAAFILLAPQSTPRVQILSVALAGLMLCVDLRRRLYKFLFPVAAFSGVTFGLPWLSQMSRGEDGVSGLDRLYRSMDFAQFQSIAIAAQYTLTHGLSWGRQLLGDALFFVPRQLWADKPLTTAELVATAAGMDFTNISMPIAAELFIDFGFAGLAVLSLVFGRLARNFDQCSDAADHRSYFGILYYAVVFATFGMVVRGSLAAVLPFVVFPLLILFASQRLMLVITQLSPSATSQPP